MAHFRFWTEPVYSANYSKRQGTFALSDLLSPGECVFVFWNEFLSHSQSRQSVVKVNSWYHRKWSSCWWPFWINNYCISLGVSARENGHQQSLFVCLTVFAWLQVCTFGLHVVGHLRLSWMHVWKSTCSLFSMCACMCASAAPFSMPQHSCHLLSHLAAGRHNGAARPNPDQVMFILFTLSSATVAPLMPRNRSQCSALQMYSLGE